MERTFVKLHMVNRDFIRNMQAAMLELTGRRLNTSQVLNAMLSDYKKIFETGSDPDVLTSFRRKVKRSKNLVKVLTYVQPEEL